MTPSEPTRPKLPENDLPTMQMRADGPVASTQFTVSLPKAKSLGDFELLTEVGRGGMGRVYKARQRSLDSVVALKTILPELATPALVQRFRKEAEAAGQLDHPGIVPVYKFYEHEGQHFFTMPFVEGRSLEKRLKQGPLDNRLAALVALRVAEAVDYAHGKGVVHRDLKPGNVLLGRDGSVKVTDFGLARRLTVNAEDERLQDSPISPAAATVQRLTLAGTVMGTPGYIAPEQALDSSKAGAASDIWAIGAILYSCLTGRPPFVAASAVETLAMAVEQDPAWPHVLNTGADFDLETICLKCLRKDPAQRYATAGELARDLAGWLEGQPPRTKRPGPLTRARRYVESWPELVPVLTGLAVYQLGNMQEALLAGCALAGIGLASRRAAARVAMQAATAVAVGFILLLLGGALVADLWVKPFALFASGAAIVTGLATVACGNICLARLTPNGWRLGRIVGLCLAVGLVGLGLALGVMQAAEELSKANSPWEVPELYAGNWAPLAQGGFILLAAALLIGLPALLLFTVVRIADFALRESPPWRRAAVFGAGAGVLVLAVLLGLWLYGLWGDTFTALNRLIIEPGSPWFESVTALDRNLGRVASWFLAVALGLTAGGLTGAGRRMAAALNPAGKQRSLFPFILGMGVTAIAVQLMFNSIRPAAPGEVGRFSFLGPGAALSTAEGWVASLIHQSGGPALPDVRWSAAAAIFWLKILALSVPMALGGALVEAVVRFVGARASP